MERFLSCDWGTSAFRLKVVEAPGMAVIAEEATDQGVAAMYARWKESGEDRFSFYLSYIKQGITVLENELDASLQGLPLLMSGMVTSSLGMMELPYKELPFFVIGSDLLVKRINAREEFDHEVILISGARTGNDVLRGEETQLVGCLHAMAEHESLFIFPGTHAKHITVSSGRAVTFKTYMTGEFFDLLSRKSILSASVEETQKLPVGENRVSFEKGLLAGVQDNLLHSSFLVRTNHLFNLLTKQENYSYLSGLLIGTELKEVVTGKQKNITIVGNELLAERYRMAFDLLFTSNEFTLVQTQNADRAVVNGQFKVWTAFRKRSGQHPA